MRIVGHLDMDAFFASVEERDNPRFKGKPIVVGADPVGGKGRGVVSTANYAARKYGIHSAMPISEAWRLAEAARKGGKPATVFSGGSFGKYSEISHKIFDIVREYAPLVEQSSVDEGYFEFPVKTWEEAEALAKKIKKEIKTKERVTATIGIGPNKLISKIATDVQKPDGLTIIRTEDAEKFLEPLSIREIPGVGPKTEAMFAKLGVKTVKDLKKYSRADMEKLMGKWGDGLYESIRGIDDSPLVEEYEVKSIGEQETFMKDTKDAPFIESRLAELCKSVIERFKQSDFKTYKNVTVTVRFSDFETKSRAHTLAVPASDLNTLRFEALKLLLPFFDKRENSRGKMVRLIGVRVEKFDSR